MSSSAHTLGTPNYEGAWFGNPDKLQMQVMKVDVQHFADKSDVATTVSQVNVAWIRRPRERDVVIACEPPKEQAWNSQVDLEDFREHLVSNCGVPQDARWFDVTEKRTALTEKLFAVHGRDYLVSPVEFHDYGPKWGAVTSFEAMGSAYGLEPVLLHRLCLVNATV